MLTRVCCSTEVEPNAPNSEISEITVRVKERKEMVDRTFRILRNKYVLDKDDKIMAPSNQNVSQLIAELTARQLSTEGRREDLKKRVMVRALQCVKAMSLGVKAQARKTWGNWQMPSGHWRQS